MSNLSRWVRFHARRTPSRTALIYADQPVSYGELWERLTALGGWLREQGIESDDRVALLMKNSSAFIEFALGTSHIGAVLVPINFRLAPDEVNYIVADSGARILILDEELASSALAAPRMCVLDAAAQADTTVVSGDATPAALAEVAADSLYRIMYTSGTTDRPKGVVHSYANVYAKSADQAMVLGVSSESRLLVVGPLYHVGAFDLPGVAVFWSGGSMCVQREFAADAALAAIERHRLNCAWLAPVMTSAILERAASGGHDATSLEWVIGGGERTPEGRIMQFNQLFPHARYIDAYGLTETCGGDTFMEAGRELEKIGSTGRPVPNLDIEIRDDEGRQLDPFQEGEICLRGPKVTAGYWNAPDKTRASFFGEWLRTGDVGYLDGEGFLYITDRKKDMILSGGENIASSEIERVILEMPDIRDVAVIGVADARWGERPIAFAVPSEARELDEQAVRSHCKARLAGFKVPDRVVFVRELPRSASGKVLKRVLRENAPVSGGS